MKILLVNTVKTGKNGITNVMFNYLNAIECDDITFDLVSLNEPEDYYTKCVEKKGGKVYVIPRLGGNILSYWNSLKKLINENRYDAVHVHGNSHTVTIELSAAWAASCAVRMAHAHNTTCKHVSVHKLLTPLFNLLCTHGFACGEAAGTFMFGRKTFAVINNGVDTDKFAFNPVLREKKRGDLGWDDCIVVGHVGYFSEVKNHRFLIEVFEQLYLKDDHFRLLLVGDGALRNEMEEKIKGKGLKDKVVLTGNIDNVHEYLNAMDIVIMPSLYEGLPLTLIEQQANGLPCVVADTITREVDKTGNVTFLSLSQSAKQWAGETLTVMEHGDSRQKRSNAAIEKIKDSGYSIKEEAQKLEHYYKTIERKKK